MEDVENQTCIKSSTPCWKFILMAVISLGTTSCAFIMLFRDGFQNTALTSFATSTISANVGYWLDSPSFNEKKKS